MLLNNCTKLVKLILLLLIVNIFSCSKNDESIQTDPPQINNDTLEACIIPDNYFLSFCEEENEDLEISQNQLPNSIVSILESTYNIDTITAIFGKSCKLSDTLLFVGVKKTDEEIIIHAYNKCFDESIVLNDLNDSIQTYKPLIKDILNMDIDRVDFIWRINYLNGNPEYLVGIENNDCYPLCVYEINFDTQDYCTNCE